MNYRLRKWKCFWTWPLGHRMRIVWGYPDAGEFQCECCPRRVWVDVTMMVVLDIGRDRA